MLDFPRSLHQFHVFEQDGELYAADLDKARIVEISAVISNILKLAETQTTEEITQVLKTTYSDTEITQAFEILTEYARQGVLFTRGEKVVTLFEKGDNLPRLLLLVQWIKPDSFLDIEKVTGGIFCCHACLENIFEICFALVIFLCWW